MQTITTKYLPATNTRGARIKATSASGISVTMPLDYSLTISEAHRNAMISLCEKLKWTGTLAEGNTKNGYVYVFVDLFNQYIVK
jgi:hypothetical protein